MNNAAITYFIPVSDFPEKRFRLMMDVQVWAPFELAQLVLPGMQEEFRLDFERFVPRCAASRKNSARARRYRIRHVQSRTGAFYHWASPGGF